MTTILKAPCDEAVIRAGEMKAPCSKRAAPWVLAATIMGSSITFIDSTVVGVALPVLQRELGTDIVGAQWIVEAYSLMLSALILVGGSLGDRWGRKRVFSMGLLLFTIASAGCGLSQHVYRKRSRRSLTGSNFHYKCASAEMIHKNTPARSLTLVVYIFVPSASTREVP